MDIEVNGEELVDLCFGVSRGCEFSVSLAYIVGMAGLSMSYLLCLLPGIWMVDPS